MSNNRELKVDLVDVLEILVKRKRIILGLTFLIVVATAIYTLVVSPRYQASTVLMPPTAQEASSIKSILKSTPLGKLGGLERIAGAAPSDLSNVYLAILASRSLQLDVIKKFDLVHVYKFDKAKRYFVEDLLKEFNRHIDYEVLNEGTMVVHVEDESPKRAADMANYMVRQLDEIYKRLTTEKNRNHRMFLGERLAIVRTDLDQAEKRLVEFQKRNRMIDIESQAKATVSTGVNLEARYLAVKGNLEVARKTYSSDHPRVRELQLQMEQLEKQRRALSGEKVSDFLVPYQAGPDLALEYLRLAREQEIQQTIFEMMLQQYEEARFEESKNTPNVQVLDRAEPPQKRIYPKRRKLVMMSLLFGLALGSIGVLVVEYGGRFSRRHPEEAGRLKRLLGQAWAIRTPR
jgi:tyrosine-protein kinase Etk/Wzc